MSSPAGHRHDLTGLRSVAVLLVVLFHAEIPGFEAGFIGVDVFFALSGFLITRGLMREVEANGRIDLSRFWAARARRLLPAATLVIVVTLLGSMLILSPFVWRDRLTDAWASSLYWANFRFGSATESYFGTSTAESPFLHFWSLSIEEQTYLALPLLIALSVKRPKQDLRVPVIRLMWVLFVGSLTLSVMTTQFDQTPMTYFFSGTRVWEIAAGGLLALHAPTVDRALRNLPATAVRGLGFSLLAASLLLVDPSSVFPGAAALLPVAGALLIIAAIGGRVGPLEHGVPQWIGERSYSWYLWHWPVIVLGQAALERWAGVENSWLSLAALAVVSLVPAAASYRWVEQPVRSSLRLRATARNTVFGVGAMVLASFGLMAALGVLASARLDEPVMLALDDARTDYPFIPATCSTTNVDILLAECAVGPSAIGTERILLLGDSHMANWAPAFRSAGVTQSRQVISALGGSCPIIGNGITFDTSWCAEMRAGVWQAIDELEPTVVVLSHSAGYYNSLVDSSGEPVPDELGLTVWSHDLRGFVAGLRERSIDVVVVQPTPINAEHPILCASFGAEPGECTGSRSELTSSVAELARTQREALAGLDGVSLLDPIAILCPSEACVFEENGVYVWNDEHHITTAYAATKAGAVAPYLD